MGQRGRERGGLLATSTAQRGCFTWAACPLRILMSIGLTPLAEILTNTWLDPGMDQEGRFIETGRQALGLCKRACNQGGTTTGLRFPAIFGLSLLRYSQYSPACENVPPPQLSEFTSALERLRCFPPSRTISPSERSELSLIATRRNNLNLR